MASHFTREELQDAFREDTQYGLSCLEVFFQDEVAGYIKCVGHGSLKAEDIADLFHDVIVKLIRITKKPDFNPADPMAIVYRVARLTTLDFLDRQGIRNTSSLDGCLQYLAEDLKDTDLQLRWKYLSAEEKKEFYNALFEIIGELPDMQRASALGFVGEFEEIRKTELFTAAAEAAKHIAKVDMTTAAAKRNWYRARDVIAKELINRGLDVFSPE